MSCKCWLLLFCLLQIFHSIAQSTTDKSAERISPSVQAVQQRESKAKAIDKLVQSIGENKDTYPKKVIGQLRDSTGEATGSFEIYFNYNKKSKKLLSLFKVERGETGHYLLQCYFYNDQVIRIDVNTNRKMGRITDINTQLYYENGKLLLPVDIDNRDVIGKLYLDIIASLLLQQNN